MKIMIVSLCCLIMFQTALQAKEAAGNPNVFQDWVSRFEPNDEVPVLRSDRFKNLQPNIDALPTDVEGVANLIHLTLHEIFDPRIDRSGFSEEELLDITYLSALYYMLTEDPRYLLETLEPQSPEIAIVNSAAKFPISFTQHLGLAALEGMNQSDLFPNGYPDYRLHLYAIYKLINHELQNNRSIALRKKLNIHISPDNKLNKTSIIVVFVTTYFAANETGQLGNDEELKNHMRTLFIQHLVDPLRPFEQYDYEFLLHVFENEYFAYHCIRAGWYDYFWGQLLEDDRLSDSQRHHLTEFKLNLDQRIADVLESDENAGAPQQGQ